MGSVPRAEGPAGGGRPKVLRGYRPKALLMLGHLTHDGVVRNLIVGVDGTAASAAALKWATDVVGTEGRVHAVVAVNPWTERVVDVIAGRAVSFRDAIERDLASIWTADAAFAVGELQTSVSEHTAAVALNAVAIADDADAIVIGRHHGVGGLSKRLGHSTNQLLRNTDRPVIVVPTGCTMGLDGGNVVVGVGHGDATRTAVRWGAHLARTRPISIELLHATGDAPVFQAEGPVDFARYELGQQDRAAFETGQVEHFAELMQTLVGPGIDLTTSTPPGLAAHRLDEASERSALLVIGRHRSRLDLGHHTAQPLRYVLTHARCPVAVIADHLVNEFGSEAFR
jgi:nucleotide-binding universal stress UspA family protein